MNIFGIATILSACLICTVTASNYDLLLNLLPLYGSTKLSKILTPRSLSKTMEFFERNPKYYESFKNELASEGVYIPNLKDFNINVITASDFALVNQLVGNVSFRDALNSKFVQDLVDKVVSDEFLLSLIQARLKECGITYNDNLDLQSVGKTILETFEPIVPSFMSTLLNIVIFG